MTAVIASPGRRSSRLRRAWRYLAGLDLLARSSLVLLAALLVLALLGWLTGLGGSPTAIGGPRLEPPSTTYPAGTDNLGRSLLPRLFAGIVTTLLLSVGAVIVTAVIATAAGVIAGYSGGRVSRLIMGIGEVLYAFPAMVLAILVTAIVGKGSVAAVASIVLVTVPLMTRMVGQAAREVASRDFIVSAVISGVPTRVILVRHVLRNVAGTVAVQASYALSVAILVEAGLSFLGYGVQPPGSSLGLLVQNGTTYMVTSPYLVAIPGLLLVLSILSINLIGDSLRDRFEPRDVRSLL